MTLLYTAQDYRIVDRWDTGAGELVMYLYDLDQARASYPE